MASFKEKLDKNGNRIYEVQASNGRGRRVWRTFHPEPTWSKRTIQRDYRNSPLNWSSSWRMGKC